jgi:hypothetical protein
MYRASFPDDAPRGWRTASSPSPAAAVGRHRTPHDDAPVYDPLLWRTTDNAYISTLATRILTHPPPAATPRFGQADRHRPTKPPFEKFLSSSWTQSPKEAAASRLSMFHAVYDRRPTTWIGRVLQFISARVFHRWHEQLHPTDVTALSTKDLIQLMQLALAAGEVERSAMLARELSRRKLALHMQALPAMPSNKDGTAAGFGAHGYTVPPPPVPPLTQPLSSADYEGFYPHREPPQQQQQQGAGQWNDYMKRSPGPATWCSPPRSDYGVPSNQEYSKTSRPVSVERTAPWRSEASRPSPSPAPAVSSPNMSAPSQSTSDISVSSLRMSEGGSAWRNHSRWSGQWISTPLQTPY